MPVDSQQQQHQTLPATSGARAKQRVAKATNGKVVQAADPSAKNGPAQGAGTTSDGFGKGMEDADGLRPVRQGRTRALTWSIRYVCPQNPNPKERAFHQACMRC